MENEFLLFFLCYLQFLDRNDESGQETILSKLCFVSKVGVLTFNVAKPTYHNDFSLASLIMC